MPSSFKAEAICGVVAPVAFAIILAVAGLLQPGYNQVTQQISELGYVGSANPEIQNGNFVLTGLLITVFSLGLRKILSGGHGPGLGPSLLTLAGIGLVGAGLFPGNPDLLSGAFHGVFFLVTFVFLILVPLMVSRNLDPEMEWGRLKLYSKLTWIVVAVLLLTYLLFADQEAVSPFRGVFQRILVATPLLWIEIMAITLLRRPPQGR